MCIRDRNQELLEKIKFWSVAVAMVFYAIVATLILLKIYFTQG